MFPFCKKKPLTRAQRLKQTVTRGVSDGVHQILDRVPVKEMEAGAHHALETAQHAGSTASRAIQDASHVVKETVLAAVHQAAARAEEVDAPGRARAAATAANQSAHVATDRARHALESAGEAAGHLRENALSAAQKARAAAEDAREAAEEAGARAAATARHAAEAAREAAVTAKANAASKAALAASLAGTLGETLEGTVGHWKDKLRHDSDDDEPAAPSLNATASHALSRLHLTGDHDIQIRETGSKWLWILVGLAIGALLALLFAPTSGRRSRAAIQDRLRRVRKNTQDALSEASDKAADISNRAHGMAHHLEQKLHGDDSAAGESDAMLADKVRTALGHLPEVQDISRINVETVDGTVTLRGPMVTDEVRGAIEACVRALPGVKAVISDFLTDEPTQDPGLAVG